MEPSDASAVIESCRIASGIQLLRDLGDPQVLKENDTLEMCLLNYLEKCPKMRRVQIPVSVSKMDPNSHWWWQDAKALSTESDEEKKEQIVRFLKRRSEGRG